MMSSWSIAASLFSPAAAAPCWPRMHVTVSSWNFSMTPTTGLQAFSPTSYIRRATTTELPDASPGCSQKQSGVAAGTVELARRFAWQRTRMRTRKSCVMRGTRTSVPSKLTTYTSSGVAGAGSFSVYVCNQHCSCLTSWREVAPAYPPAALPGITQSERAKQSRHAWFVDALRSSQPSQG